MRLRGAMVARLTPDQKVACSSHVGVILPNDSVRRVCMCSNVKDWKYYFL